MMMRKTLIASLSALLLFAATCMACAQEESVTSSPSLPAGMSEEDLVEVTAVVESCSGNFADIAALYMVEASPLITLVESEMLRAQSEDATAQSKSTSEAGNEAAAGTGGDVKGAILRILESEEWDALLNSESLQKISDEMELDCVMENEAFAEMFMGIVGQQGVTEDHELYPVIKDAPAIIAGYYSCGGRIKPVMQFADGVVPDILGAEAFDPLSILSSPHFIELQASGFDMACFFGVPEVSGLLAGVMG
ncbi:hypothetical protein HOP50_05g38020 [Chloropicon primus]|uniref:Uncharacterized protein n=1 Tax=Chloropicon primus TaxID=1764295 RepID=A0A5B8MLC7_9CHLO|nr:hypothetical protein A3770_05p37910 [Chloropicon primus]UPR00487.1 hypothetical protein HOP50_05g38020 [Chloropicon primus]|eukprot:QDZ21273.1 hypothetical protein A3770_05p37910 [Chloropicon primus]